MLIDQLALGALMLATWQTLYMVFMSAVFTLFFGLVMGFVLYNTAPNGLWPHQTAYRALGMAVNIFRSVPFIILMVAILPLTRLLIGTTIGMNAAIVPLIVAATPFYARIAEAALASVPAGIREVALAMGANDWQMMIKFLLPEALPGLIKGATLTIIGLIGYSAMAGAVGGGGLGELAINYGYQRFNLTVMLETVVLLVIFVQLIQQQGDRLASRPRLKPMLWAMLIFLLVCLFSQIGPRFLHQPKTLRVGIVAGTQETVMEIAKKIAWTHDHVRLQIIPFDDYVLPNTALNNGDIDANIFQHAPYLEAQIKSRHYQLSPIAKTFIYPLGFYSKKYQHLAQIPEGAKVAIPNDPSNEGRALLLLQKAGLIQLKSGVGLFGRVDDILKNPHHWIFITLDAAQIPRVLADVAMGALTNDFIAPAGFRANEALLKEDANSPYANLIVVRTQDRHDPRFIALVNAMHSAAVQQKVMSLFPDGAAIPAFSVEKNVGIAPGHQQ